MSSNLHALRVPRVGRAARALRGRVSALAAPRRDQHVGRGAADVHRLTHEPSTPPGRVRPGAHSRNEPIGAPWGCERPATATSPGSRRRSTSARSSAEIGCVSGIAPVLGAEKDRAPLAAGTRGVTAAAQVGGPGRPGREAAAQGAGAPPTAIGRCSREPPEAAGRPPARHHAGRAGPALQRSRLDVPAKRRPAPPMLVGLLVFSREWVSMPSVDCGMSTKL